MAYGNSSTADSSAGYSQAEAASADCFSCVLEKGFGLRMFDHVILGAESATDLKDPCVRSVRILRWPGRFGIGRHLRLDLAALDRQFDVHFYNPFVFEEDDDLPDRDWGAIPLPEELRTWIAIVNHRPRISPAARSAALNVADSNRNTLMDYYSFDAWQCQIGLKQAMVALTEVERRTRHSWITEDPYLASDVSALSSHTEGLVMVVSEKYLPLDDEMIISWIIASGNPYDARLSHVSKPEWLVRAKYGSTGLTSHVHEVLGSVLSSQAQYAHYELAFQSREALWRHDYWPALILACAAMEGAHAALIERISHHFASRADAREIVSGLLREQGIFTLMKVTPKLFMHESNQPSTLLMGSVERAIKMRNAIAHVKRDKVGSPTFRTYSESQFVTAVNDVLELCVVFDDEIRRRSHPTFTERHRTATHTSEFLRGSTVFDDLRELASLRDRGVISENEFASKKHELLERI